MSVFGRGLSAAVTLRQRILEDLGAEEEWTGHGPDFIAWMSGPAATFFHVQPSEAVTPDLGVLRIVTPVAAAVDRSAACCDCDQLTAFAIWCVREQIAEVNGAIAEGVGTRVGDGTLYGWGAHSDRETRQHPHAAARRYPEKSGHDSAILAGHLRAAFGDLRNRMIGEGTAQCAAGR